MENLWFDFDKIQLFQRNFINFSKFYIFANGEYKFLDQLSVNNP